MSEFKKKRLKNAVVITLTVFLAAVSLYVIFVTTGIGFKCLFNSVTGFKCAGCGNTHAIKSLLELNFKDSLHFNYLYPLEFFYIGYIYVNAFKNYINGKSFNYISKNKIIDIAFLIILIAWWILRNILGV